MTKRKRENLRPLWVLPMLCAVIVLAGLLSFIPAPHRALAASEGVDISTGMVTNYYMDIPMKGRTASLENKDIVKHNNGGFGAFSRTDKAVTLLITFENISYNDMPVFVSVVTSMEFPAIWTTGKKVIFNEDLHVNIRETYFNYFQGKDFGSFRLKILYRDKVTDLNTKRNGGSRVFTNTSIMMYQGASTPTDPSDPDFELGGGDGVDAGPVNKAPSWLTKIAGFFNLGVGTMKTIIIVLVCAVVGLFLVILLRKALKS